MAQQIARGVLSYLSQTKPVPRTRAAATPRPSG
jgi:hypothetical protein